MLTLPLTLTLEQVVSSNKLLGQLGQGFPTPQAGFKLNEKSLDLNRSCVLLISHSGGTFGTLNCANLLKVREIEGDTRRYREM